MVYENALSLNEARSRFFQAGGLGDDGGYNARWVRVESKPIPLFFPNTACRVAAAKLHDLHHVATEYGVDWPGEAEIAAWEIASGCGRYGWAWLLNLGAFTIGLLVAPRRLWRAFVRGRHAKTNLYHAGFSDDQLPRVTVGALRRQLGVNSTVSRSEASDLIWFVAWAVFGASYHVIAVGCALIACALMVRWISFH